MSARAALVFGFLLMVAALLHGGFYSAGQDFVVNRFTGQFQFVPAEDEGEPATQTGYGLRDRHLRCGGAVGTIRRRRRSASAYSGDTESRPSASGLPRSTATCTRAFQARLLGRTWPFSQRLTVENVTPSACARCSCVSPVR